MESDDIKHLVESGQLSVGIELGSTRIKTIAIAPNCETIATGSFEWENKYENGYWTYSINDVWVGIQKSYAEMSQSIKDNYHVQIKYLASLRISGMLNSYLYIDDNNELLFTF